MTSLVLFDNGTHRNIFLEDFGRGQAVQANQHLIVDGDQGMLLDPGGHKVYAKLLSEVLAQLGPATLQHLFFSHQDPDVVAAANGWLMSTTAMAWTPVLWTRFIPHFGLDSLVADRLQPIADEGMVLPLGTSKMLILPAHFLHSPGNCQVYDPVSRILYSGDLGGSFGTQYQEVSDFEGHIQFMLSFHQRYMTGNKALRVWAKMVRQLDIEMIVPQHGAFFRGSAMVAQFVDWCERLQCGIDLMPETYLIPK